MGENISLTFQHMGFKLKDVLQVLQVAGEQLDGICQISLDQPLTEIVSAIQKFCDHCLFRNTKTHNNRKFNYI